MKRPGRDDLREQTPRALVRLGIGSPRAVLVGWLLVCLLALPGLARITIEASTESILDRAAPEWGVYQESLDLFGGDEVVVVALQTERPFDAEGIATIERLSRAFEGIPGVRRVDSITTQSVIRTDGDGNLVLTPASDGFGTDPLVDAGVVADRARLDRILPDSLVSRDGTVLAINLVLERDPAAHYDEVLGQVARHLREVHESGTRLWVSGVPVFQRETSLQTRRELFALAPLALIAIGALLTFVFRSFRAAVGVLATGAIGNLLMLSSMGAMGVPVSFPMVILPPIILALAAAYGMHILTAAARERGGTRELGQRIEEVATPLTLSGLTTAIGFAASALTGIETVRNVGAFGGVGVLAILALTLTALPAFLVLFPLPATEPRGFDWLRRRAAPTITRLASTRSLAIIGLWAGLVAVSAAGIARLEVDTDATRWFRPGTATRDDYETIRALLSGISPINVVVEVGEGSVGASQSVLEPDVLQAIDRLSAHLASQPQVGKVVSVADPLRQLHAAFESPGGPLPADRAAAEQYLLLLESVEQIDDLITADRRHANILLRLDNNGSSQILGIAREAERWWAESGLVGTAVSPTGVMFEFARAQHAISRGQILGLGAALVAIVVVLLATFRRPLAAAMTLVPNILPLAGIYGAMGFLDVPLDAGTVLVGSLALGIAVDDTVHLASAYFERSATLPPVEAMGQAVRHVLPAITYTTGIIGLGFLLLGVSDFTFIRNLGILMSGVVTLCLLADIGLLPTLLLKTRWRGAGTP